MAYLIASTINRVVLALDPRYVAKEKNALPLIKAGVPPIERTYDPQTFWWTFEPKHLNFVKTSLLQAGCFVVTVTTTGANVYEGLATSGGAAHAQALKLSAKDLRDLQDYLAIKELDALTPRPVYQFSVKAQEWALFMQAMCQRSGQDLDKIVAALSGPPTNAAPKTKSTKPQPVPQTLSAPYTATIDARLIELSTRTGEARFMTFDSKTWAGYIAAMALIDWEADELHKQQSVLPPPVNTTSFFHVLGFGHFVSEQWLKNMPLGADEFKRAYRRLSMQYHPDVCKAGNAAELFNSITEAYKVLTDPLKGDQYTRMLRVQLKTSGLKQAELVARSSAALPDRKDLHCGRITATLHTIESGPKKGSVYVSKIDKIEPIVVNGKTYVMKQVGSSYTGMWE